MRSRSVRFFLYSDSVARMSFNKLTDISHSSQSVIETAHGGKLVMVVIPLTRVFRDDIDIG